MSFLFEFPAMVWGLPTLSQEQAAPAPRRPKGGPPKGDRPPEERPAPPKRDRPPKGRPDPVYLGQRDLATWLRSLRYAGKLKTATPITKVIPPEPRALTVLWDQVDPSSQVKALPQTGPFPGLG
jgi:hypothetical protein